MKRFHLTQDSDTDTQLVGKPVYESLDLPTIIAFVLPQLFNTVRALCDIMLEAAEVGPNHQELAIRDLPNLTDEVYPSCLSARCWARDRSEGFRNGIFGPCMALARLGEFLGRRRRRRRRHLEVRVAIQARKLYLELSHRNLIYM